MGRKRTLARRGRAAPKPNARLVDTPGRRPRRRVPGSRRPPLGVPRLAHGPASRPSRPREPAHWTALENICIRACNDSCRPKDRGLARGQMNSPTALPIVRETSLTYGRRAAPRRSWLMEERMNTDEQALLQKIAGTLEEILSELRKGSERHQELDQANADVEYKRQNPFDNV